jgi:predicted nuclease of predicted toxin-antitoxin system
MPGSPDPDVLAYACKEERILVTDDKDFGVLVFRLRMPCKGVILIRMSPKDPVKRFNAIKNILSTKENLQNKFVVLEEKTARIREI